MSRSRWHHRVAEWRSCAGVVLQQFNAIDGTIKLLNGDVGGAEAGPLHCDVIVACNIVALAAIVSCVRKTHIGFIFVFYFWTLFPNMRLLRRFRRAGCSSGGEWPLPPEGTALGCCAGDAQRGPRCCRSGSGNTLSRHTSVSAFISQSFDQHPRSGRLLRRCAWVLLRGDIIAAAGPCITSRLARHDCSLYFSPATETSARLCVSAPVLEPISFAPGQAL